MKEWQFDKVNFDNVILLTYEYRQVNDMWRRWKPGAFANGEGIVDYIRSLLPKVMGEVFKYSPMGKESLTMILSDLLYELNECKKIYKEKKLDQYTSDYKLVHKFAEEMLHELKKFTVQNKPSKNEANVYELISHQSSLYENFNDLFKNKSLIEPCINLLRELEKPMINDKDEYIGGERSKSVLSVWVNEIQRKGWMERVSDKTLAILLNKKFPNLNLYEDGSAFSKISPRAEAVRNEIQVFISAISYGGDKGDN